MVMRKLLAVVKSLKSVMLQEGGPATKMDLNLTTDSYGASHVIFFKT